MCAFNHPPLRRIAVTMGDPAGIGPEICLHLLKNVELARVCTPVIFGDASVLKRVVERIGVSFDAPVISRAEWKNQFATLAQPTVVDLGFVDAAAVVPGKVDALCGDAAFRYVIASIEAGLAGEVAAVSTAPLNKEAMHAAGHRFPGHTEIFAERMKAPRSCMMLTSPEASWGQRHTEATAMGIPVLALPIDVEIAVERMQSGHRLVIGIGDGTRDARTSAG